MAAKSTTYKPERDGTDWETVDPAAAGLDRKRIADAAAFAAVSDSAWPRSFYYPDGRYVGIVEWNETGPWSAVVGPVKPRGNPSGLILKGGAIVAEWGDTRRADMTFSVAKSYLALLAGLALKDGLIKSLDGRVAETVRTAEFEGAHNGAITWRHLLHQSSEWRGELFGKSDQVDHHRQVGAGADNSRKGQARTLGKPGSHYEYNDVRVNLLALALLHRFRRPLPEVLKERVMDPIGASPDWRWNGYSTSVVEIDGRSITSVSGGAHWGGGMLISARDHARVGLLVARSGRWGERELIPAAYIREMLEPSPTNESYGMLWWLNQGSARYPAATPKSFFAMGAGTNLIWVAPERDLVAVLRWIDKDAVGGFIERVMGAVG